VQFGGEPQGAARRKPCADAPPESIRQLEVVRIAAEHEAAEPRELDTLIELFAQDDVEGEVSLACADALVVVLRGGDFDHAADGQRERMLFVIFSQQVHFAAEPQVAQLVVRPSLADKRVVVDDASSLGLPRKKDRSHVAIDATNERPRTEHFRAVARAERERQRPVADVSEALVVVVVDTVSTCRPLARRKHLTDRHEPEPGVSHEGRRRRASIARRLGA
jgi:hypothetical protein